MQISRRVFMKALAVGVGSAAIGSRPAWGQSFSKKPNIVLCMADDQGWGDMAYTAKASSTRRARLTGT